LTEGKRPNFRIIGSKPLPLTRVGLRRHFFSDTYHFLMKTSWPRFFLILSGGFVLLNAFFAFLYLMGGDGIAEARHGSFEDAFFFSVQTIATLGYGREAPVGMYANLVVTLEVFSGLMGLALATGLTFSKFSRPTARVLFSKVAVIAPRKGVPCLMFRMANARTNHIIEANLRLNMLANEVGEDGKDFRRFHDMKLFRDFSPVFKLTWLAIHPIDPDSPLYGKTREDLEAIQAEIIVSLSGIDDIFLSTVHKQHSYIPEEILWNASFEDVLSTHEDRVIIDYSRFHRTKPLS